MSYFPIYLNLEGKEILIVGGGNIALEKLQKLLPFTKNITIIAKEVKYDIYILIKENCLTYYQRPYHEGDIDRFDIVVVATDDINLQKSIFLESRGKHILVNSVDNIKYCDFIFPSIIKRENLTITISTNGASPAFSKELRLFLENLLPSSIDDFLSKLKELRDKLPKGKERMQHFEKMVKSYFKENIKP
ncbi:MAG: bifunctional precorrin-2 dehydrogenase/sirohydrochlorin ferrochelatase [Epsilonproteobacteria bacterium]|nr:bifunctional precorrin-2 dehydrogenase/sirohydrochlorin ferrochelatase [Campylobacterota bacterium]